MRNVSQAIFATEPNRILWLLGLIGVATANLPNTPPAQSGHFASGTALLLGYGLSAALMLRWGKNIWVRRLHVVANTLLLLLVASQVLLGVNRLYKFGFLSPVPQDQATRSLLFIKFGLESPSVTAVSGKEYGWTTPNDGKPLGGNWRLDGDAILQADCGCSGNQVQDTLTIDNRFPLLIFNDPVFGNFDYSAEFKIDSGQVDQYAGLAFRIANEFNYYVVRASASEQSVTLARFNNGSRQVLASFPAAVKLGQWHTLQLSVTDIVIRIQLDGQPIGETTDDGWRTGRVGLGTKSDSIARFRHIKVVGQ